VLRPQCVLSALQALHQQRLGVSVPLLREVELGQVLQAVQVFGMVGSVPALLRLPWRKGYKQRSQF
jgi:hypothetical protein